MTQLQGDTSDKVISRELDGNLTQTHDALNCFGCLQCLCLSSRESLTEQSFDIPLVRY